jgi:acetyl esterase
MAELHPQARELLDRFEASGAPPPHTVTPEQARKNYEDGTPALAGQGDPVASVTDRQAPGPAGAVPLRVYRPGDEPAPVLVWLHGGGFVVGSLDSHDALCRRIANLAGCVVVAVDYRLAPEHPFPAAFRDSLAAVEWVRAHAAEIGADPARLSVGGDSAGGNLAAVVARHLRDLGAPLELQVLVYPVLDSRFDWPSYQRCGNDYYLLLDDMRWYWDQYAPDPSARSDPDAAPLRATDLSGVAPGLIIVAGFDPLHDEGVAYAERLRDAGVEVELVEAGDWIHGYVRWLAVSDAAGDAVKVIADRIRA